MRAQTDADPERERHKLKALSSRQVEGLILAPSSTNTALVEELIASGLPVVLVNRSIDSVPGYAVTPDDRRALRRPSTTCSVSGIARSRTSRVPRISRPDSSACAVFAS